MTEGIGSGDGLELLVCEVAEGTAGAGEEDLVHLVHLLAHEALEDSGVLGVDGQQVDMILLHEVEDELTGHDERLFVGEAYLLAGFDGADRRLEACEADEGSEHHVDGLCLDDLAQGLVSGIDLHVGVGEACLEVLIVSLIGDDHGGGVVLPCLLSELLPTVVGGQRVGLIEVGVLADDVECLGTNGSRGPEDTYLFLHCINDFIIKKRHYIICSILKTVSLWFELYYIFSS